MFATKTAARTISYRIAGFALAIVVAAVLGLAVGSALNDWTETRSRTATASFSIGALEAVRVTRGDPAAAIGAAESDYGLRHGVSAQGAAAADAESDYGLRHGVSAHGLTDAQTDHLLRRRGATNGPAAGVGPAVGAPHRDATRATEPVPVRITQTFKPE